MFEEASEGMLTLLIFADFADLNEKKMEFSMTSPLSF